MDDKKQRAVNGAKDAAIESVGFIITGTAKEAKQLRSAALQAAKGAVAVRKAVASLADKFSVINKQIGQIKDTVGKGGSAQAKLVRISGLLSAGGDAYKEEEAEQEAKPDIAGTAQAAAAATGKAALGIGALALAIPFLLSPEVREMIMSFFNGFLEGLGISNEAMGKAKFVLGATLAIIGTYFSAKVLASVGDAFGKMKQLAEALGLAGEKVAAEKATIDADKAAVKKGAEEAGEALDGTKKQIKKGKKLGKLSFLKKFGMLKTIIGPKIVSIAKNLLKAIPFLGTLITLGFIISDIFDIGSAIYDMFTGDDDEKDDEDTKKESAPAPSGSEAAPPAPAATATAKPAASGGEALPATESVSSAPAGPPASTPASLPTINVSAASTGQNIDTASVAVQQADVDAFKTQGNINIVNMKNSTIIVDAKEDKPTPKEAPIFSVTVGA